MSAYLDPYFEALWPLVESREEVIPAWCQFFDHLEAQVSSPNVAHWGWSSATKLVDQLIRMEDDLMMKAWLLAFLKRRKCIELRKVSEYWLVFVRKKRGIHLVKVYTAHALSQETKDLLVERLKSRWSPIEIHWKIDPKLLGGARCYMDDYCWDLSINSNIEALALAFGIRGIA